MGSGTTSARRRLIFPTSWSAQPKGEGIVIAKAGEQKVRLVQFVSDVPRRKLGALKGHVRIAEDFDAPLPAGILYGFYGDDRPGK